MRGDLVERRYSDEELRSILKDAARTEQQSSRSTGVHDGLTLAEIRGIAQEVGIDPAEVDRAAANLVASEPARETSPWSPGLTRILHEELTIPRSLDNAEMRLVAAQAQRVLGQRGTLSHSPDWVEWRDRKDRLYIAIMRGTNKTRIRVIADQTGELVTGSVVIGTLGLFGIPSAFEAGWPVPFLLIGGATSGLIALYWKWRSRATRNYMRELLEILQEAVR